MKKFILILVLISSDVFAFNIACRPLLSALDNTKITYGTEAIYVEDLEHRHLQGAAYLSPKKRLLKISFSTRDTAGNRAHFSTAFYLKNMLTKFKGKYDSVEVDLRQNTILDSDGHIFSKDIDLDKFNDAYPKAKAAILRQNTELVKKGIEKPITEEEAHNRAVSRAAAQTVFGFYIGGGIGFGKITIADSLGEPGSYQMLKLRFEPNGTKPLLEN